MTYEIRLIAESDVEGFREVLARERRYLSFLEAPPLEQMRAFVLENTNEGFPQFVALVDGQIVGWCDILPNARRAVQAHCGTLGMGLLPNYRERGAPFTTAAFARIIERAGEVAKLGFEAHPHMLRHATGYKLANDGHNTRALQAYLGHENIQHTVRYTELAPGRFKDFWRD